MNEMERLKQLERALLAGGVDGVDADELAELLGAEAAESFGNLRRMMRVLHESGYLTQREGHATLSPKGVRKIGQLALRDIYQGLLRDRPGSHPTSANGIATVRPESTKPYRFGEPLHLDLPSTLKRAVAAAARHAARARRRAISRSTRPTTRPAPRPSCSST